MLSTCHYLIKVLESNWSIRKSRVIILFSNSFIALISKDSVLLVTAVTKPPFSPLSKSFSKFHRRFFAIIWSCKLPERLFVVFQAHRFFATRMLTASSVFMSVEKDLRSKLLDYTDDALKRSYQYKNELASRLVPAVVAKYLQMAIREQATASWRQVWLTAIIMALRFVYPLTISGSFSNLCPLACVVPSVTSLGKSIIGPAVQGLSSSSISSYSRSDKNRISHCWRVLYRVCCPESNRVAQKDFHADFFVSRSHRNIGMTSC